jgi:pyruvate/2-oxoglutarate dehydrogenase complex dihydrolipoamide dehydrogenase (E3) component
MARQASQAKVHIHLDIEVTPEFVTMGQPDAVVVACGAIPSIPAIRGIERPNVFKAADILSGKIKPGKKVAIIGGGMVGCEVGHFLASRGHSVTILEILGNMAADINVAAVKQRLINGLKEKGATFMNNVECRNIEEGNLTAINGEGKTLTVQADTVVIATGSTSNPGLFQSFKGKVPEVYQVGDALKPARILEAIESGRRNGQAI